MRNFLIGLAILFFGLSGIVIFKALQIPAWYARHQNSQEKLQLNEHLSESEEITGQFAGEREENQALVRELQDTVSRLEDKLSGRDKEKQESVTSARPFKKARVLTVFGSGMFDSGQVDINENLIISVKELIPDILAFPDYRVVIEGHTDNKPIRLSTVKRYRDNMELSFLRAKDVADVLVENGVPPERISVIGYGDTRPVASNETNEGRAKNRRVEVKLMPEDREF